MICGLGGLSAAGRSVRRQREIQSARIACRTPNPKPQTPDPRPQTPDPRPQTPDPDPKPQTPDPKQEMIWGLGWG